MAAIFLKTKRDEQLWKEDKERLKRFYAGKLDFDFSSELPDGEALMEIIALRSHLCINATAPIKLDTLMFEDLFVTAQEEIEELWKVKLPEKPTLEVLPYEKFCSESQSMLSRMYARAGKDSIKLPAGIAWFADHLENHVIVPEGSVFWTPNPEKKYGCLNPTDEEEVSCIPYEKSALDSLVSSIFTRVLYRQVRKEWRDGFLRLLKNPVKIYSSSSFFLQNALDILTQEALLERHPERVLHAFGDKVVGCWMNIDGKKYYKGIQALVPEGTFADMAKRKVVFARYLVIDSIANKIEQKIMAIDWSNLETPGQLGLARYGTQGIDVNHN